MSNKIKLSKTGRKYTEKELALLSRLSERKRVNSKELAEMYFEEAEKGLFDRGNIISSMRNLITKMEFNNENFRIMKTKRQGPRPTEFWLERRRA